ncbi:hypothetical protein AcV7_002988 [Taiwanofungus camphoratus]|nr:hypothetical protein AcV7_002988 [Antrodia cinnamomea]
MVFGFFSKKQPMVPPELVPLPPSPSTSATKLPSEKPALESHVQLRTPSPSIESASVAHGAPNSPSPATKMSGLSVDERTRQLSPTRSAQSSTIAPRILPEAIPPEPTIESLTSHITAVPAKLLHTYVLAHIPHAPEPILSSLASFFAELAPPPRLHCVRCHKDYVEIENSDRSCLVPHDDDSAEVERVGRAAKRGDRLAGDPGTTYETLWGCCGKTTEGDGDQGPPDGWCYEGKHTTDIKRARFRADSTPHGDKLISCLRLNCHGIRDQMPRMSTRKRTRSLNMKDPNTDDDESEGDTDSGMDEIVGKKKGKGKGKAKAVVAEQQKMDVDDAENASRAGSARGRPKAQENASAPKRRGRAPKSRVVALGTDGEDAEDAVSVSSAPTAPKRRGRKPKSKAYISDSDMEEEGARSGPRTRSISRTRASGGAQRPQGTMGSAKLKPRDKKVKVADERDENADSDQPKKKRRVVE